MLDNVLSLFGLGQSALPAQEDFRRRHVRYSGLDAEVVIGKHTYAVHDWDLNGIAFETTPDNSLDAGTEVQMSITFKLPHETIIIEQQACIFRIARRGVSVAMFTSMHAGIRRQFERVLDSLYTQKFLESQVA